MIIQTNITKILTYFWIIILLLFNCNLLYAQIAPPGYKIVNIEHNFIQSKIKSISSSDSKLNEDIKRVISQKLNELEYCFDKAIPTGMTESHTENIDFIIDQKGQYINGLNNAVSQKTEYHQAQQCLVDKFKNITYPAGQIPVKIKLELSFKRIFYKTTDFIRIDPDKTQSAGVGEGTVGLGNLSTISSPLTFEQRMIKLGLIDVNILNSKIKVKLAYSTKNNFLNEDVYGDLEKCYLIKNVAIKLSKAQQYLTQNHPGLYLEVLDCARPRSVQYKMWDIVKGTPNQQYVADPSKGSIHNFGAAVDLTIVNDKGVELDMGTAFDYAGELSQPQLEEKLLQQGKLTVEQVNNRKILRKAMHKAGFKVLKNEWWHFDSYPLEVLKTKYRMIE